MTSTTLRRLSIGLAAATLLFAWSTPLHAQRYVKGERVRHRRFGSGTIRGLSGVGRDLKVTVVFDDAEIGEKQLLVAYAGLEREWESA